MPNARLLVLASLLALIVLPSAAQARKPIVAYVDAGQRLHLYDAQIGREVAAPALAIPDRIRGFGVSSDGRYIAYRDAAKVTHLYDRSRGTDAPLPDAQGTPRSVSNAGVIASDAADNGPTRLYDGVAKKPLPSGLDDANGDNKHRQSRISGDGRFLATTCLAGCLKDTGGDSDVFVEDLRALADTAFPDDISGQAARDEEHPCISGDGRLVGADTAVGNQHDVFIYDRTAKRSLALPQINRPNADDAYCALDAGGAYVAVKDGSTDAVRLYTTAGAPVALPAGITGPAWLVQPPTARAARLIARVSATPSRFRPAGRGGAGTVLSVTLTRAARVRVALRRGGHIVRSYSVRGHKGVNRLRLDGRARRGRRLVALAPGRCILRISAQAGRAKDVRTVSVRVRA